MIEIDGRRLNARLQAFAAIGGTRKGGVNRQALTEEDRRARRLLAELAWARGFSVFQDPMANLFIRRAGQDETLPPMLIGSHLDSQPAGGRFDGALGTLSAFEVLESLEDAGIETERPVVVVAWTNEEGCRFAPGCMGSMAFAAGEIPAEWQQKLATDGAAFAGELKATIESLPRAQMLPLGFPIHAYLEVHIEQGPSLEAGGISIGVVTGIQGTRWLNVEITGQTAHAGTTGLAYRRDPLRALTTALSGLYEMIMPSDPDARFTIGRISVEPGSVNAIPDKACCTVDIRHPDPARLDELERSIASGITTEAERQRCTVAISRSFDMPPCTFAADLQQVVERAAAERGLESMNMLSGAFHDALFVNRVAPSALIFVPCLDGLSHNEAEHVEPEHIIAGCQVLAQATLLLVSTADS
ncbi:Zn-dependent hydrolase [Neorhizobium petrolearium]|uniref:Zn-dependent hydrolase n=1 Tax=Neorhizobium petrolearium TaxID=515361 RepID=A0ABY8MB05_9HYPH|nr:Zn-dependent hydrolase [Neorhizobium petrolearium]MCC2614070.1 Zn-dependent hydrolase [Neorhizobium petrolearium]WGI71587.1 Zn-dependent hydrolase [Neorhizobium petrolearium]